MLLEKLKTAGDHIVPAVVWLLCIAVVGGMLWAIWRPKPAVSGPPQLQAYHTRQQQACAIAKEAQAKMQTAGLEQYAQKLDVDSVCDPQRTVRYGVYWLLVLCAIPVAGILLLFAISPRY